MFTFRQIADPSSNICRQRIAQFYRMFLPDVEQSTRPSPYLDAVRAMQKNGAEYPQIWHMFAFLPRATEHLARFTQEIMREPAPLNPGLRELIAAYTSHHNHCPF